MSAGLPSITTPFPKQILTIKQREKLIGISWREMPGQKEDMKRINFAALFRRDLPGYHECYGLTGDALRRKLREVADRRRRSVECAVSGKRPTGRKREEAA